MGRSPGEGKGYPLTPVFWPGEFRGLYSPWSCRESGTTERLSLSQSTGGLPGGTSGKELACQCRRRKETRVWSLGWADLLEDDMATHSSILAWRIPWTEEPGSLQSVGSQRDGHDCSNLVYARLLTYIALLYSAISEKVHPVVEIIHFQ